MHGTDSFGNINDARLLHQLISCVVLGAEAYVPCAKVTEPRWDVSTPLRSCGCYLLLKCLLQDVRRVTNGFNNDWMPSGYRDVKVNPVVNKHLCEIQLHLGDFSVLKSDQHAVYEWARDLKVTTKMRPTDLFSTLSREVTEEMIRLARQDWRGTGYCLPELLLTSGQYNQAEEGLRQVKSNSMVLCCVCPCFLKASLQYCWPICIRQQPTYAVDWTNLKHLSV